MKKTVTKSICLLIFIMCISCVKTEKSKKAEATQLEEIVDEKTKSSKQKDLFEKMFESLDDGKQINKKLGGLFEIEKATIIVDPKSDENIYLVFLLNKELTEEDMTNFKIHLDMFPYDNELSLLREDTKERKRKYDSWYFKPKIKNLNGVTFLYKIIDTPISNFKQIYIHLYDINKKVKIEESIVVKDLQLN